MGGPNQEDTLISAIRLTLTVVSFAFAGAAWAQGGLQFGVSVNPMGPTLNGNVSVPMFEWGGAVHAARGDVTYGFAGLPGVSLTYQLSDALARELRTYVGFGAGVGFVGEDAASALLTLHGLAGANARLLGPLGAYGEVVVGGSALATNMRFALGVSYELGGER